MTISELRFQILVALADGAAHGYAIGKTIEARTGGRLDPTTGTLYQELKRMLREGLIRPGAEPGGEVSDGRRKYFELTPPGRHAAAEEASRLDALVQAAREKKLYPASS